MRSKLAVDPPIYLDCHATTPCDPRVVEAMLPAFTQRFGNAASRQHAFGLDAAGLVERARGQVAALIGCDPREIVFTSGATESNNLAIKGFMEHLGETSPHVVTSAVEHKAVLDSCRTLERKGVEVTYVGVGPDGCVRLDELERALRAETALVSIMYANNEIGTVQPVREIGRLCRVRNIRFHCDAAQAAPYLDCDVRELEVDLLSLSAHKMYGPKGIGALYVRRKGPRVRLRPLLDGGGHERGLRSGTLNVPGIVGFGAASELVLEDRASDVRRAASLRDRLRDGLLSAIPDVVVNGCMDRRLPNNLNVSFLGVDAEKLIGRLRGLAISSGAACSSASRDSSYVLRSLGASDERIAGSVRFGLGRFNSAEEIERAVLAVAAAVRALRAASGTTGPQDACMPACG